MSEADKMFDELGYDKSDNHPEEDEPHLLAGWTTQDERVIEYSSRNGTHGLCTHKFIHFHCFSRDVICHARLGSRLTVVPLSVNELKAICKKCEELRWI